MKTSRVRWLLKVFPIVAVGIFLLAGAAPAQARPCFTSLASCYYDAAGESRFWWRWAWGLDCELGFLACARMDVFGR